VQRQSKEARACTIPARKLYDYVKLLRKATSIKLLENHWVQIRSGRSNEDGGHGARQLPQVPEFPT